jgi:DNA-binding PadR family transcriptional regulator
VAALTLSTTSYSILGYLAVRPWSAYELTKQMGRTFHHFWPRAESGIYREVKRLVDAGLAAAESESTGRRIRTRYEITPLGQQRLGTWLAEPRSAGFLEAEGLVRVLFADHGTKETLQRTLTAMADDAHGRGELLVQLVRDYAAGKGDFPRRSHINLLIAQFIIDFAVMVEEWAAWASEEVDSWPDVHERDPDKATLVSLREAAEGGARRLARLSG